MAIHKKGQAHWEGDLKSGKGTVSTESGAARMARATGTAAPARQGGAVLNQGSAQDKARELLAHLRRLGLTRPPG